MSKRAIKQINWGAILERTYETDKHLFSNLKAKSDQYLRKMLDYPETSPKIDWAMYKKSIPNAALVDKFQKEYDSVSVPYPADNYTSKIEELAKQGQAEMDRFVVQAKETIAKNEQELVRIAGLIPFDEMTMEEVVELYPDSNVIQYDKPSIWPHDEETNAPEDDSKKDDDH